MNNYNNNNNTNNFTSPIGNTNHHHHHPHQYHIHPNQLKYQYSYPEQLRLIDPNQALNDNNNNNNKKRINFHHTMSAMATPILSASSAGSYITSNTIGNKDLNKTFLEKSFLRPPQSSASNRIPLPIPTPISVLLPAADQLLQQQQQQQQHQILTSTTPLIDLKKYGTTNFIGFNNKIKTSIPSIPSSTNNNNNTPVNNNTANSATSNNNNNSNNNFVSQSNLSKNRLINLNQYQSEREKFFAEYIKNNGDAASLIISPYLYLGGHRSVNNVNNLVSQGITHILNMASELKLDVVEMNKNNIKLLHIPAKDAKTYNIRNDFDRAFHFIDECLRTKGKIIINCARGISRSATIVIGYLMFRYNMRLTDAFNYTLSKRPQVRPNSNFRRQLEIYEQELIYNRYKISIRAKTLGFATPIPAAPKSATNNPTYRF